MSRLQMLPKTVLRLMRYPPRIVYALGLGSIIGRLILLLTTRGRKTGKARVTPLQFEKVKNQIFIGSMRGKQADWYKNILADAHVQVQIGSRRFDAVAEPISDPEQITDFLELRFSRHPRMIARMLQAEGLSPPWTRDKLTSYAQQITIIAIPIPDGDQ
jgi:deazaflavin-dependent oxidoreductase (nitroreductase family)